MQTDLQVRIVVERSGGRAFNLDVEFSAPPGITILFGPSGSGKSTTLAAIAGLLTPGGGRVALGNEVWFDAGRKIDVPIHRRGIAFVFQSLALFPHLTAVGNVEYGIDRAQPRGERYQRAREMLERMRVGHLADRKPSTFSGGEAQRVALARAFARSPRLVLLDEPKLPLLHVTHHRNEARAIGSRVVLLEAGRVKAVGALDELLPKQDDTLPIDVGRREA